MHLQRAYQCGRGAGVGSGSHCGVEFGRRCHTVPKWVYSSGRLFFVSVRTNKRHHHHHHHPARVSAQKNPSTGGIGETQAPTQREREGGCGRGEERERSTRHQVNNLQQCGVAVGNARHAAIFPFSFGPDFRGQAEQKPERGSAVLVPREYPRRAWQCHFRHEKNGG